MMNDPNHRSVPAYFFASLLQQTTVGQEAASEVETEEEEGAEPRGWALKWDAAALSQIRERRDEPDTMDHGTHTG